MSNQNWTLQYRRKVLDHVAAPQDVDLSTVEIAPSYALIDDYEWIETGEGMEEHSVERPEFSVSIVWLHHEPAFTHQTYHERTSEGFALYQHSRTLVNQEAVRLLLHLDS